MESRDHLKNGSKKNIMKKILILIITVAISSCVTSNVVSTPAPMSSDVATNDTQDINYIKANEWMIENFNNAESVIQFSDKDAGLIKGKYLMKEGFYQPRTQYTREVKTDDIFAIITIRVKDNKSRIEIALTADKYVMIESGGKAITPSPQELAARGNNLMQEFATHMKGTSANETW